MHVNKVLIHLVTKSLYNAYIFEIVSLWCFFFALCSVIYIGSPTFLGRLVIGTALSLMTGYLCLHSLSLTENISFFKDLGIQTDIKNERTQQCKNVKIYFKIRHKKKTFRQTDQIKRICMLAMVAVYISF